MKNPHTCFYRLIIGQLVPAFGLVLPKPVVEGFEQFLTFLANKCVELLESLWRKAFVGHGVSLKTT